MPKLCPAAVLIDQVTGGEENHWLVCMLAAGHPGLHYDSLDDVSWKQGLSDA